MDPVGFNENEPTSNMANPLGAVTAWVDWYHVSDLPALMYWPLLFNTSIRQSWFSIRSQLINEEH